MAIEYEDFEVHFAAVGNGVLVRVECPAGEATSTFRLEGAAEPEGTDIFVQIAGWWRSRLPQRHLAMEVEVERSSQMTSQEVGTRLFKLIFQGRLLSLFDQSLGIVHGRDQGLRVVLRFDLRDETIKRLSHLPWELLYREETDELIALSVRTPIVRHLDVGRPTLLPVLRQAPHVLMAIAGPAEMPWLDSDNEERNLKAVLENSGAGLAVVSTATRRELAAGLVHYGSQILHFVGHGGFEEGEGVLYLEGPDGAAEPVSGARLAATLADAPALRFVFLNACETAVVSGADGSNPFAGVASALVDKGVPAVLAMQAAIPDKAAIAFSQKVYDGLALGDTIEEAVSRGRAELHDSDPASALCAIPVLFTRIRERVIPRSLITWLWTLLGIAVASLSFNTWSKTQGWLLEVPGLRFSTPGSGAAAIFGMLWGIPLFALFLQVTRLYRPSTRGTSLAERLPVAFDLSPAKLGSIRQVYQRFFFTVFLLMPMAAQIHFFDRVGGGDSVTDRVAETEVPIWKMVPFRQLLDEDRNRFNFNGVTFYPGVEPWFLLVLELMLFVFFLFVCRRLLAKQGGHHLTADFKKYWRSLRGHRQ